MKARTSIILFAAALMLAACQTPVEQSYSADPVENVEALWEIIDTKYCYIGDKGIDWDAIRTEYIAKAAQLKRGDQFALFDLCAAMLDSLRDGHVNLYSPFDRSASTRWYEPYPSNFSTSLQRQYLQGGRMAGSLQYNLIDDGRVGYVYYSSFSNDISVANLAWVFRTFADCRGLIIDVRQNGGGSISNSFMLSSPFFSEDITIAYMRHKTGPGHNDFSDPTALKTDASLFSGKWNKPVVVLSNRMTYSAANLFVNIMRYAPNATIVGGKSGGGGGLPMSYEMPIGWLVRFSSVRMYDREMKDIEQGIEPDVAVTLTGPDKDDIIEAAIDIINGQ
ncbi:MAG: S41 family peptidase [Paludibacteraceae bacterium]|nr:S41 family peptidase [Paludibacteraceae bacterium]